MSQIEAFAFDFAPKNWMPCAGQTLPKNQYQALFALLGTTYGGDGINTFQLPDLRGRFAIGMGPGTGLPPYVQGQQAGEESVTLTTATMPQAIHTHAINANNATTGGINQPGSGAVLSSAYIQVGTAAPTPFNAYSTGVPSVAMGSLSQAGGQPHDNLMPTLALNYCICVVGLFPSRG
ncbi:MAG TPA: tail fiber protein [Acetobacteraceae bacterium]